VHESALYRTKDYIRSTNVNDYNLKRAVYRKIWRL